MKTYIGNSLHKDIHR